MYLNAVSWDSKSSDLLRAVERRTQNPIYKIVQLPIFFVFKYKRFLANDLQHLFTFTIIARNIATSITIGTAAIVVVVVVAISAQIHFD